jgi:hypothetical protein
MNIPTIEKINIPPGTLIASAFPRTHYADAYRARLPASSSRDIEQLTRMLFATTPQWIEALLRTRDRIVGVIGLKTAPEATKRDLEHIVFQPGSAFGLFKVFERADNEIMMGEDDSHLDFRVSVLLQQAGEADWLIVSTVVRFNNWLGRAYFLPVHPLHQLIVPAMMRSAIRKQMRRSLHSSA